MTARLPKRPPLPPRKRLPNSSTPSGDKLTFEQNKARERSRAFLFGRLKLPNATIPRLARCLPNPASDKTSPRLSEFNTQPIRQPASIKSRIELLATEGNKPWALFPHLHVGIHSSCQQSPLTPRTRGHPNHPSSERDQDRAAYRRALRRGR